MLALGGAIPISPYVTTLSFLIYVVCRVVGGVRDRRRAADAEVRDGGGELMPRTPQRTTRQRTAVGELLAPDLRFRTASQIHDDLRHAGEDIGLTTVYRTLQLMVEAEQLDAIRTDDGETAYRRCSTGHHHHLVCRTCGRTVEVEGPAIETLDRPGRRRPRLHRRAAPARDLRHVWRVPERATPADLTTAGSCASAWTTGR